MIDARQPDFGLILVDHGSQHAAANDQLNEVARMAENLTGIAIIEPAHMELAEPTIAHAFERCVARGARFVVVHPYFLAPGRHSTVDIPRMAAEAASRFPDVDWCVTDALGLDARMVDVIKRRVDEALARVDAERKQTSP